MSTFKTGDYVVLKHGIEIEDLGIVTDWSGQITYIGEDNVKILLDAPTLRQLTDEYLQAALKNEEDVFEYYFLKEDLKLSKRRDRDAEYDKIKEEINSRLYSDGDDQDAVSKRISAWAEEFENSEIAKELSEKDQEFANFIADTFTHYAWNYVGDSPENWDSDTVKETCLHYVVGKVSEPAEEFENYGRVLANILNFWNQKGISKIPQNYKKRLWKSLRKLSNEPPTRIIGIWQNQ